MKKSFLFILLALVPGCMRQASDVPVYSAGASDMEFQYERHKLKDESVPFFKSTPFDTNIILHKAYMAGVTNGWDLTIKYGDGILVAVPQEFAQIHQGEEAWRRGFTASESILFDKEESLFEQYRTGREQLSKQSPPHLNATPYDTDAPSRKAYLDGLKAGWDVTIKQWIISQNVPIEYNTHALEKAWSDGYDAGQKAVLDRVDIKEPNSSNSAPMSAQQK
jgi:hypothetical protein